METLSDRLLGQIPESSRLLELTELIKVFNVGRLAELFSNIDDFNEDLSYNIGDLIFDVQMVSCEVLKELKIKLMSNLVIGVPGYIEIFTFLKDLEKPIENIGEYENNNPETFEITSYISDMSSFKPLTYGLLPIIEFVPEFIERYSRLTNLLTKPFILFSSKYSMEKYGDGSFWLNQWIDYTRNYEDVTQNTELAMLATIMSANSIDKSLFEGINVKLYDRLYMSVM